MTETPERYDSRMKALDEKIARTNPLPPEPTVQQAMARIDALDKEITIIHNAMFGDPIPWAASGDTLITESATPEMYCRINITKNTKGYSGESTVSLRGSDWEYDEIGILLRAADIEMRTEIARREALDAGDGGL